VIEQAQQLNQAPLSLQGKPITPIQPPVIVESADVGLEVLKKAEKDDCLVLRVVERKGKKSKASLRLNKSNLKIQETDLMEWQNDSTISDQSLIIELDAFQIKTFRITEL